MPRFEVIIYDEKGNAAAPQYVDMSIGSFQTPDKSITLDPYTASVSVLPYFRGEHQIIDLRKAGVTKTIHKGTGIRGVISQVLNKSPKVVITNLGSTQL